MLQLIQITKKEKEAIDKKYCIKHPGFTCDFCETDLETENHIYCKPKEPFDKKKVMVWYWFCKEECLNLYLLRENMP